MLTYLKNGAQRVLCACMSCGFTLFGYRNRGFPSFQKAGAILKPSKEAVEISTCSCNRNKRAVYLITSTPKPTNTDGKKQVVVWLDVAMDYTPLVQIRLGCGRGSESLLRI